MKKLDDFLMRLSAKVLGWWLVKYWPNNPVERNTEGFKSFKEELSKFIK